MTIENPFIELLQQFYIERSRTLSRAFDSSTPRVTRMKMKIVAERSPNQDIQKDLRRFLDCRTPRKLLCIKLVHPQIEGLDYPFGFACKQFERTRLDL